MTSREAFEAWHFRDVPEKFKRRSENGAGYQDLRAAIAWVIWQAAIQHARDVAVKACEEYPQRDPAEDGSGYWAANNCADAIKEALNTGAATPGNKGTTPNS